MRPFSRGFNLKYGGVKAGEAEADADPPVGGRGQVRDRDADGAGHLAGQGVTHTERGALALQLLGGPALTLRYVNCGLWNVSGMISRGQMYRLNDGLLEYSRIADAFACN